MNSPKLKVLQVITPRRFYGAERMVVYLSEGLRERGHEVFVACKANEDLERELASVGIPAYPMEIAGKINPQAPFRLARLVRRLKPHIIHTHLSSASLWGSVAGLMTGVPVLAEVHAQNTRTCFMLARHILTCSEGVRQHLARQQVPLRRMDVLYNGLPQRVFEDLKSKAEIRRELGLDAAAPVVGAVAHLASKKGQRHLLEALPALLVRFPDLVCLIVGEGETRAELEEVAEDLQVLPSVRFLGYRADAVQLMVAMDVVVLPSVAKEGLGVALIEAGFLGKPVVGSSCGGIAEVIVDGETGLLAPPGDALALAERITRLLLDPALAEGLGAAGRRRVSRHFSTEAMAARAEDLYYKILRKSHRWPTS